MHYLPKAGWHVDVVSAPERASAAEFSDRSRDRCRVAVRARVMSWLRRGMSPIFALIGIRPRALPLSTAWIVRGNIEARRRVNRAPYDAVLATGPPMVALLVARLALRRGDPPLLVELRDLWAGNPYYDRGGRLLSVLERWVFARADHVVACTPEALADLCSRNPHLAGRVTAITNGFEPAVLELRQGPRPQRHGRMSILHSGGLYLNRPLTPLLRVLEQEPHRSRFRLILHGYLAPETMREIAEAGGASAIEVLPPSDWRDAIRRVSEADVTLITQGRGAGDATAVAAKVYEYLALGKPVLCISDGGATEALLRRLGADSFCARLDDKLSIAAVLKRLHEEPLPPPIAEERLAPYDRTRLAACMEETLSTVCSPTPSVGGGAAEYRR
jgi:hypothetical protein